MRRLGDELEVCPATHYGHVRTKEDVLDLALDAIFAEVPLPKDSGSPDQGREELGELLRAWRSMLIQHPWSSTVLGHPQLGPQQLAREERLYALLAASGLTKPNVQDTAYALSNYVIGSVLMQVAWQEQDDRTRLGAARHIASQRDLFPPLPRIATWPMPTGIAVSAADSKPSSTASHRGSHPRPPEEALAPEPCGGKPTTPLLRGRRRGWMVASWLRNS